MSLLWTILPPLLGGLGLFLLGMKHLSEGLQATAGGGLRRFMAKATSHRIVGVGSGIISTMIVQSSSIITVMLVGFVSTALMTLPQAFAVLIGANIGTTATVWIIAYAPDPQLLGFVGLLFYKASGRHPVGKLRYGGGAHVQKFAEFACAEPVVSGDDHKRSLNCGRKRALHVSGAASEGSCKPESRF